MFERIIDLRSFVKAWHRSNRHLEDGTIDRLLGLRWRPVEARLQIGEMLMQFGPELLFHDPTPYTLLRELFRIVNPERAHVFYDLGAGYGRVLLYGGLVSPAAFRGIEIIPARVTEADRVRRNLDLQNVQFIHGNVRKTYFDDGDIFFFYNPFFVDTLRAVTRRLRRIAIRRPIRVVSIGKSSHYFRRQNWLREQASSGRLGLRFFVSHI